MQKEIIEQLAIRRYDLLPKTDVSVGKRNYAAIYKTSYDLNNTYKITV